jgi:hypothetical protein
MITEEDVNEVLRCCNGDNNSWWVKLVKQYAEGGLGEDACKNLKAGIVLDLSVWSIMGSFIISIAFGALLTDNANSQPLTLIHGLYVTLLFYSAVMSLQAVLSGTFKYLCFATAPPTAIVPYICNYLNMGMKSSKNHKSSSIYSLFRWFFPHKWDHMLPIYRSICALCFGFVVGVHLKYNDVFLSLIIFVIVCIILCHITEAREEFWKGGVARVDLRPLHGTVNMGSSLFVQQEPPDILSPVSSRQETPLRRSTRLQPRN